MPVIATEVRLTTRGTRSNVHNTEMGLMILASIAKFNRNLKEKERRRRAERDAA